MTKLFTMPEEAMEAVLYLKDGNRRYGMLLNNESPDSYHFLSNTSGHIEIVPAVLVENIDTYLK